MDYEDTLQLLLRTLQFWTIVEKQKTISEEGLEQLQEDVDIVCQYLDSTPNENGHFEGCCCTQKLIKIEDKIYLPQYNFFNYHELFLRNQLSKSKKEICKCSRFNSALFRMKYFDKVYE